MSNIILEDTSAMRENSEMTPDKAEPNGIRVDLFCQHNIELKGTTYHTLQIPCKENGNIAVVEGQIETNIGSYAGTGVFEPHSSGGTTDTDELIQRATAKAMGRASTLAFFASQTQAPPNTSLPPNSSTVPVQMSAAIYRSIPQKPRTHSTTKPASEKQLEAISKMCARVGITEQEARAQAKVNPAGTMTSNDAHQVITLLKNQRSPSL